MPIKTKTEVIAEFILPKPAFRTKSRIILNEGEYIVQHQDEGEPNIWQDDDYLPWHKKNLSAIIREAIAVKTKNQHTK